MARSWQRLERTQALQGKSISRICARDTHRVFTLWQRGYEDSLDASAPMRQVGKGNSLGENVLTIHNLSFASWSICSSEAICLSQTFGQSSWQRQNVTKPGSSRAYRENGARLPVFKPRRFNCFWFLLSFKGFFFILKEGSHSRLLLSYIPGLNGSSLDEATGSWS